MSARKLIFLSTPKVSKSSHRGERTRHEAFFWTGLARKIYQRAFKIFVLLRGSTSKRLVFDDVANVSFEKVTFHMNLVEIISLAGRQTIVPLLLFPVTCPFFETFAP